MNKLVIIAVVVVLVAVGGFIMLKQTGPQEAVKTGPGRVVVSVTDAALDMSNISEVTMTVNKVELHSEVMGWVTVSTTPKTYSLLDLKARGESALAGQASVSAGTYNQIRATISNIKVTTKAGAVSTAKLPSGELKLNGDIVVNSGETTSVNLDFLASASLHLTGNGLYVFAPVVHLEVRSDAQVDVNADEKDDKDTNEEVEVEDGAVEDEVDAGMDVNGEVKEDFELKDELEVESSGSIKVRIP